MQLVGTQVLEVSLIGYPPELAVHANCAVSPSGAVVLSFSNLAVEAITLEASVHTEDGQVVSTANRTEYFLTSGEEGNLQSSLVLLNGQGPLAADSPLTGLSVRDGGAIVLPPLSYGFVVLDDAKAKVCMRKESGSV